MKTAAFRLSTFFLPCLALFLALGFPPAWAGSVQAFTFKAKAYAGSRDRQYKVYTPSGFSGAMPMVMALHGCRENHDDVLHDWGLASAADRHGFILVAPFITSYDGLRTPNCWGFWLDGHRHEGRGEPEDLHQIALQVESHFAIDGARRFITGLSSGAAMAVVAATTHNEYWAAAASASGLPYGEEAASVSSSCPGTASFHSPSRVAADMRAELNDSYPIPLMILQNDNDCTVPQMASRNLRDAHLLVFGDATHRTPDAARTAQAACTPIAGNNGYGCQQTVYTPDGRNTSRSLVETVFYGGPLATPYPLDTDHGHYWIGGTSGVDGKWSLRAGPSYPDIAWSFFERHPRTGALQNGRPQITLVGANPMQVEKGNSFNDPGAIATDPEDGALGVIFNCNVDTSRAGRYTCSYSASDSGGNTVSIKREVNVVDTSPTCAKASAPPRTHILAGRAAPGGWWSTRAITLADHRDIGLAWDFWSTVVLREGQPGQWYAALPAGCER